ncbi:lytic murein transglycosylase [Micromonospora globbae]|nr:lytic murein transglycosylase [Micromonospora globbae]
MGDTRRVVDGEDRSKLRPLRPAAPLDGPLAESGAAPDPAPGRLPRPRRPWLRAGTPAGPGSEGGPDGERQAPTEAASTPDAPGEAASATGGVGPAEPRTDAEPAPSTAAGTATDPTAGPDTASHTNGGGATDPGPTSDAGADARSDADPKADADTTPDTRTDPVPKADADTTVDTGAGTTTDPAPKADATTAPSPTSDAASAPKADADSTTGSAGAAPTDPAADAPGPAPARRTRGYRVPFAHAVRLGPRRAATAAARATRSWSRRPSGRLTLTGVVLLALVAATAAAGALVVPATIRAPRPVAADATAAPTAPAPGLAPSVPASGLPDGTLPTTAPPTGGLPASPAGGRPADALAGWAQQIGPKVGISPTAMQAYGYAELVLAQTNRSCALSWTTLAAIGFVESSHGQANGATLGADGRATPEIIGLPLDGRDGRMRIIDTDRGQLDRDTTYDRAIGPMQFIPTTWQEVGVDADNDGRKDPHDIDDAALAAANYLCRNGRNLSIPADWWNAILSYNDVRRYAQDVFDTANRYGRASRT